MMTSPKGCQEQHGWYSGSYVKALQAALVWLAACSFAVADESAEGAEKAAAVNTAVVVMSANVRFGTANDGANSWEHRKELVVETFREIDADLVGTQEMLPMQAQYLQDELPQYFYVGTSREPDNTDGEQCGIFVRRDRFVLLELGHFWLSDRPELPGSMAWDTSLPRMATWVKLHDRARQRTIMLVNTHFDHRGQEARAESAKLLRSFAARHAPDYPLAITGDFNAPEASPPYQNLLTGDAAEPPLLRDTYRVVHPQAQANEGTFNGFEGRREGGRIDWILASPQWTIRDAAIVTKNEEGRYPSDHFFVTATLE
jgi:endonuclease/exonuclease/phosphatase family metal-dependent hydrolase